MRSVVALGVALALIGSYLWPRDSAAQAITVDPTGATSLGTLVTNDGNAYTITGGTEKGTNLFHSFVRFNVPSAFDGGRATFEGPASTTNVISRVTGGQLSSIDGVIDTRSFMPSANFFFINPAGVTFGANAFLDVGGAVRISTANYVRLDDGVIFSATPGAGDALLTSAVPQAFGFLGNSFDGPGITLDGAPLFVDPGLTLSLVGGNVSLINGGIAFAPGGTVQLVSVASPGLVNLTMPNVSAFSRLGTVTISGRDFLTVVSAGGTDAFMPSGTVVIRSGHLLIEGANVLVISDTADFSGAAAGLDIYARNSMTVRDGALVQTFSTGPGDAGGILIDAGDLTVSSGGRIESFATADGKTGSIDIRAANAQILNGGAIVTNGAVSNAGNISIDATGTLRLTGTGSEISTGAGGSTTDPNQVFTAGDISLSAGNVILQDGAEIRSGGLAGEQAGNVISISAVNSVSISSLAEISSQAFTQSAGLVEISAAQLVMDGGFINTSTLGAGNAGQIVVSANTVNLVNGAQIASSSQEIATGAAGAITVNGSVSISGADSGLFSTAASTAPAGAITVTGPVLTVANLGTIDSSTTGAGAGGAINVNASSQVNIVQGGSVRADSEGAGATGSITISAGDRIVMRNGSISTSAETSDGGNITLLAPNIIYLTNSQITTSVMSGEGGGGNVFIDPQFVILKGSAVTADAFGGPGGNIRIVTPNYLKDPSSVVTASSTKSEPGNVSIEAPENDLAGSIAQLPSAPIDASRLMAGACSARRAGAPSSFQVAGRGGVPADPDGYLPSFGASGGAKLVGAPYAPRASHTPGFALAMAGWDCWR